MILLWMLFIAICLIIYCADETTQTQKQSSMGVLVGILVVYILWNVLFGGA